VGQWNLCLVHGEYWQLGQATSRAPYWFVNVRKRSLLARSFFLCPCHLVGPTKEIRFNDINPVLISEWDACDRLFLFQARKKDLASIFLPWVCPPRPPFYFELCHVQYTQQHLIKSPTVKKSNRLSAFREKNIRFRTWTAGFCDCCLCHVLLEIWLGSVTRDYERVTLLFLLLKFNPVQCKKPFKRWESRYGNGDKKKREKNRWFVW